MSTVVEKALTAEERAQLIVLACVGTKHAQDFAVMGREIARAIREAVEEEREACAEVAQDTWVLLSSIGPLTINDYRFACKKAAERIRTRSTKD